MKNIFLVILLTCLAISACTNKKSGGKAILDDVIKVHDKVMSADEQLMKNKMQLDTLIKQGNLAAKDSAKLLSAKLAAVDSAMDNWMHDFNPDQTGKSNNEAIAYMTKQKKQIMTIDSQINVAVSESNKYLLKAKVK